MLKTAILIFNKNYASFLPSLLDSLETNNVINNPKVDVFFCDDGSSDNSVSNLKQYIVKFKVENIELITVSKKGNVRKYYSHGQLEGLYKFYTMTKSHPDTYEFIYFLDSDDYFEPEYISKQDFESKFDVFFGVINNEYSDGRLSSLIINRRVEHNMSIWPTITVTSGIAISYDFLEKNANAIFDFDYKDVWLDSRINMLAMINPESTLYRKQAVRRRIHGMNDSLNMPLLRKVLKQIEALRFLDRYVSPYTNLKPNIRLYILRIISRFM